MIDQPIVCTAGSDSPVEGLRRRLGPQKFRSYETSEASIRCRASQRDRSNQVGGRASTPTS